MRLRIRYSLRTLLLMAAVVAGVCYWLTLPTVYAERFVAAVAAGDYAKADALFADPADRCLLQWDGRYTIIEQRAQVEPISWQEHVRGERRISVIIVFRTPAHTLSCTVRTMATHEGLAGTTTEVAEWFEGRIGHRQ
jgi:hypothetical protein